MVFSKCKLKFTSLNLILGSFIDLALVFHFTGLFITGSFWCSDWQVWIPQTDFPCFIMWWTRTNPSDSLARKNTTNHCVHMNSEYNEVEGMCNMTHIQIHKYNGRCAEAVQLNHQYLILVELHQEHPLENWLLVIRYSQEYRIRDTWKDCLGVA